jgi:hypothetical protein
MGKLKFREDDPKSMEMECTHGDTELLGEQKGERGTNKYYRCLNCGRVLILSEDGVLYEVLGRGSNISKN